METRTEGWIAGLQLAALSMQGREDVAGFIEAFSGSHRHILSYLVEEVLNRCSTELLDFLLQTSILDRLSAPRCAMRLPGAVMVNCCWSKSKRRIFFSMPLDDAQLVSLSSSLARVLRQGLQQRHSIEAVADLNHHASIWYEQIESIDEAIHHSLAQARAFERVAMLVEQVALAMILRSEFAGCAVG
ncbi:MAG: hypothetical protein R2911_44140 [Caldilineaceae bacterium]